MRKSTLITLIGLSFSLANTPTLAEELPRRDITKVVNCSYYEDRNTVCQVYKPGCKEAVEVYQKDGDGKVDYSEKDTNGDCKRDNILYVDLLDDGTNLSLSRKNQEVSLVTRVCLSQGIKKEYMCFQLTSSAFGIEDITRSSSDQPKEERMNLTSPYCLEKEGKVNCPFPGLRSMSARLVGEALVNYGGIKKEWLTER